MKCVWKKVAGTVYCCTNVGCGRTVKIERRKPSTVSRECRGTESGQGVPEDLASRAREIAGRKVVDFSGPPYGPGTEFRKLAEERGATQGGCGCAATEAKMNRLGVDGCRRENESLADEVLKNSRGKLLYMSRDLARWMIEKACERAELNAPQTTESPAA